jgi:hypothetical protein
MEKKEKSKSTFLKGILWILVPLYIITWILMILFIFLVAPPFIFLAAWAPILWFMYNQACKRSIKYDLGECPKDIFIKKKKRTKVIIMKKDVPN